MVLAGVVSDLYGIEISFAQWFQFGFPISILLLIICWYYLTHKAFAIQNQKFPGGIDEINRMKSELGPIKYEEKVVLLIFVLTAVAWICRDFVISIFLPNIDDTIIGLSAAILLFILPVANKRRALVTWEEAVKLPWGILLLFGGGLAIAQGFKITGLADWLGSQLTLLEGVALIFLLLSVVASINFLTEITSNLATTSMMLPILAALAVAIDVHPYILLVGATVAASCAFMLPVATPPNAVVFGSGYLKISDMMKAGIWMNILSIIIIALLVYFVLPEMWNFTGQAFPMDWKSE